MRLSFFRDESCFDVKAKNKCKGGSKKLLLWPWEHESFGFCRPEAAVDTSPVQGTHERVGSGSSVKINVLVAEYCFFFVLFLSSSRIGTNPSEDWI